MYVCSVVWTDSYRVYSVTEWKQNDNRIDWLRKQIIEVKLSTALHLSFAEKIMTSTVKR